MRTTNVTYNNQNATVKPDLFSEQLINGQNFTESVIRNQLNISPFWTSVYITSSSVVNITYSLYDEDAFSKDPIDVNPDTRETSLSLSFNTNTQELSVVSGNKLLQTDIYNSPHRVLTLQGNDPTKGARVSLFTYLAVLGCVNPSGCPAQYCDLGYVYNPPFSFCSSVKTPNTAGSNLTCFPSICSPDVPPDTCTSSSLWSVYSFFLLLSFTIFLII